MLSSSLKGTQTNSLCYKYVGLILRSTIKRQTGAFIDPTIVALYTFCRHLGKNFSKEANIFKIDLTK